MTPDQPTLTVSNRKRLAYLGSAAAVCMLGLMLVTVAGEVFNRTLSIEDYLIFHLMAEFASIVVSFAVFTIGWYGYKQRPSARVLGVAIVFLIVGLVDFIHALSLQGMPGFLSPNTADKSATYWLTARLAAGIGLLIIPFLPDARLPDWLRPRMVLGAALAGVAALVLVETYVHGVIPTMFVEGEGLTTAKNAVEYLIIGLYIAAIVVYWERPVFGPQATVVMQAALVINIFSEMAFTLYASSYDSYNFLGHLFKVAAYYLILRAIFVTSLQKPYQELSRTREDLERSFESIGVALASSLELEKTLKIIVNLASDMLQSPYGLLALAGDDPRSLDVRANRGIEEPPATIPLENNLAARVTESHEPAWIDEMQDFPSPYPTALFESGYLHSAVAAPILRDSTVLGVLAVYSPLPKAFGDQQARLLAAFARQAAVAIGNARLYASQLDAKAQIQGYAAQLSILHEIGLSLNRETDRKKLLERVLEAAAELTSAGAGIMLLIEDGRTEVISQYYAPGYEDRCRVAAAAEALHESISRLVSQTGEDAIRINDLSGLKELPGGHLELRGLMIATLRDNQGKVTGHFLLTDKMGGADFSAEDQEVISLLAAQSSVALTSAESFEREHQVAESLQTALLPETPIRKDVEVGLLYQSAGPVGRVGGDFYDFIDLGPDRIAVAVGDVCGKGLEAAKYTAMIKYMLRAYLSEDIFPGDCLTRLNRAVGEQIPPERFITMALCIIDTARATVNYSSAGHPPAFICRESQAHPLATPRAVPLGVLPGQTYLSSQAPIGNACAIIMFTDGLIEARPAGGNPFGEGRVMEAMAGRCCQPAQRTVDELLEAALAYSGNRLNDDIALLVVRLLKGGRPTL